jgi:major membrane immunogen (membrane-anchored lipoprotein)
MKGTSLGCFLVIFAVVLVGCGKTSISPQDIAKDAYKWEKAYFDNDYKKEQDLLYNKGSFEIHKTRKKRDSGLTFNDIRYEIYNDRDNNNYYVLADFSNPLNKNRVKDNLLFRKKSGRWKLDKTQSMDLNRNEIKDNFQRVACIHCK